MLQDFEAIILDMNATFMFGHDRFGVSENYGAFFREMGGSLPERKASAIIQDVFAYLAPRYPDPMFRECFPTVRAALDAIVPAGSVSETDLSLLVDTFSHHERGWVSPEYVEALLALAATHRLGLVADIWAPKDSWLKEFQRSGIGAVFHAMSFSSDHGIVKPSPKPFQRVLLELGSAPHKTVVVGDSARRDLGGATAAGLSCVLVGGAQHESALRSVDSLLCLV